MAKFSLVFWIVAFAFASHAAPVRDRHVEAELIAEPISIQAGRPFWVALRLVHDEHWHTYWLNPGDSGLATKLKWVLPPGFSAGPIQWPYPQRLLTPPLASYGYEGEILLLVQITPPTELTEPEYTLRARADWLMCKEECLPGRADLSVTVRVGTEAAPDPRFADLFEATRRALPRPAAEWTITAESRQGEIVLSLSHPNLALETVHFFPFREDLIAHAETQRLEKTASGYALRIPLSANAGDLAARLVGVAVAAPGWSEDPTHRAILIDVPLERARVGTSKPNSSTLTLSLAIAGAFLGGLILNLMPCVFPVISIKLLGFVSQAGESRKRLLMHGLVFAAGVLICFWILAGVLLALRAGGAEIGWGFQLQSPRIVFGLATLFFVLGLSLFGLLEFGLSLTSAGQELQSKSGYAGSFFSGLLATIVATPCTAPFMGAALGYALTQPPLASFAIFTALGTGMAAPYVVLSAMPQIIRRIPRPGPWMESLKQAMGFLMMATVVWLLWVLSLQTGADALITAVASFVVLALAMWIAGRWGALHRPLRTRVIARLIGLLLAGLTLAHAFGSESLRALPSKDHTKTGLGWEPFSPARVAELRAQGRPVFIDFTAAWCLTCQVNKRVALRRPEVEARFRELGVATLIADWTDRDETIARALAEFGRSGVPFYVLYPPGPDRQPILLPEILTPSIVLDALAGIR